MKQYLPESLEPWGFRKTSFLEACERNNEGKGTLYLLKFWGNDEVFYKIGITSRTVKVRYSLRIPYDYEILTVFEDDAGVIFDLEKLNVLYNKHLSYTPLLEMSGMSECFSIIPELITEL